MDVIRKAGTATVSDDLTFVLSDESVDSYGDVVSASGWDLRRFKKNPIALFGHRGDFPIGTWDDVRVEGSRLVGRLRLAASGTSMRIDEIRRLVDQGILRAVSVGFRPMKAEPMNPEKPYGAQRYIKQELLETSLVSIPANPAALVAAKSMQISDETLHLIFGEHAASGRAAVRGLHGEHAAPTDPAHRTAEAAARSKGVTVMKTLAEKIRDAEADLNAKRDRLSALHGVDDMDLDAIEEITGQIGHAERTVAALKAAEQKIGINAASGSPAAPGIARRPLGFPQKEVQPLDLLVRALVVRGVSAFGDQPVDAVLDQRYPGHEATAAVAKAAAPLGTTGGSGFVAELQQTSYAAFMDALRGRSIYPDLRAGSMALNFDSAGTAYIPRLTAGGANGSFFAEGSPMRVGRVTTAATTMTRRKMGVIVPFSREAAERSTPDLENMVRRAILADTAKILDSHVLDATAEDTVRPAGLLNGVSAVATGYGGGDYQAVIEDINTLIAPFDDADASDRIALIMHPKQARRLAMMPLPDGTFGWANQFLSEFTVIRSTHATVGRLIAVRLDDLATALGDAPRFDISMSATVHMEDTTPAEIVSATGPTTANPVRSFFQTDTMGVRMVIDVGWKMARPGMVQWINGTTW